MSWRAMGRWAVIPVELLTTEGATLNMIRVYAALSHFQGAKDTAWPSVDKLAAVSGVPRGHISENTAALQAAGMIRKTRRFGQSVVYEVLFPSKNPIYESDSIPGDRAPSMPGARAPSMPGARAPKTYNEDIQKKTYRHPTLGVPMSLSRYTTLGKHYGQAVVDDYIERVMDYAAAKGRRYLDYAAAAANFLRRDKVERQPAVVTAKAPKLCPTCGGRVRATHAEAICDGCDAAWTLRGGAWIPERS